MNITSRGIARITIHALRGEFQRELTCVVVPEISERIPSECFPRDLIKLPSNRMLADPEFHIPSSIDILIGSGATLSTLSVGQIDLTREGCELYLQKTKLGWVIAGGLPATSRHLTVCHLSTLDLQVTKFWEIEEIQKERPRSKEEMECETYFLRTVERHKSGRYIVRLPFRRSAQGLGESRSIALRQLIALERKFANNSDLKTEYCAVIDEYLRLGHMSVIETADDDGYFLPHHAVIKEESSTSKLRVVFNASAKTSTGVSLNDLLLVGPTIQEGLFMHLIRFRTYTYVLVADIEKMFRQILIHEFDRRFQYILWRIDGSIKTLQLNTVTFGVSSSPFLATRTLKQLADDERKNFPRAAKIMTKALYVDNLLYGTNTIKEAREIRDEMIALANKGGFVLRQWASNDTRIIKDLSSSVIHKNFTTDTDYSLRTLGISWNAKDDRFYYTVRPISIVERWTKRVILSEIARIYDPIGLLGPVIFHAKRIMQNAWRHNIHWDESVPQSLLTEWITFVNQLIVLNQVSFERNALKGKGGEVQLHGFCDASEKGYGACIYLRSRNDNGNGIVQLLCSKSRVAPLKPVTIPRLELCGALLLARLYREVKDSLGFTIHRASFWYDSTTALQWIKTSPHLLNTFVANRVVEITDNTDIEAWKHVRSNDNPADALSRGQLPRAFLANSTWVEGPAWLSQDEREWPKIDISITEIPELRKNMTFLMTTNGLDITNKFSSYSKLIRVMAYCLRFRPKRRREGPLTNSELQYAETSIVRLVQAERFKEVLSALKGKGRANAGRVANLSPFLDEHGIIRVGGRLHKSKLSFPQRHPVLLPSRHRVTDNLICETHEHNFHTGVKATLHNIRHRFWIVDGQNQVRKIVRACKRCFRFQTRGIKYKMGNLPAARVREAPPFSHTGIDFAGPFYIKERKFRNTNRVKVYVCVFICLVIKAIHLEIVSELTTDGFIAALRRFSARRGVPTHVYSDNGTNFRGTHNKLRDLYVLLNSNECTEATNKYAIENHINWHFIPPAAPHYGGLWEAAVRLFKHHFKRVIGDALFTFEELNTFVTEVEGIINSRYLPIFRS